VSAPCTESHAYKPVHCDRCGRDYVCTPQDDHYHANDNGDHCCEPCLLRGLPLVVVPPDQTLTEYVAPGGDLSAEHPA
jgi:hypothetical protein